MCSLSRTRKYSVPGEGRKNAKIMIVGQAPGGEEDSSGRPFVGRAGKLLTRLLHYAGLSRGDVYITSVLKCFPPKNRLPKWDEVKACTPYLEEQIRMIKPKYIILLGNLAVGTLLRRKTQIGKIHGKPVLKDGIIYFPTMHPAAAVRFKKNMKIIKKDFKKFRAIFKKFNKE